jgi:hypothetical protein
MKAFAVFQEEFEDIPISETIPNYMEWQQTHTDIARFIRTHSQSTSRHQYYAEFAPHIVALFEINKKLPHAREELAKRRSIDKRNLLITYVSLGVALLSVILAILAWSFPDYAKNLLHKQEGQVRTPTVDVPQAQETEKHDVRSQ